MDQSVEFTGENRLKSMDEQQTGLGKRYQLEVRCRLLLLSVQNNITELTTHQTFFSFVLELSKKTKITEAEIKHQWYYCGFSFGT